MIKCVLIGAPGSGKGTQALSLSKKLGVDIVSVSHLLKKSMNGKDQLSLDIQKTMDEGSLVSDDIILKLLNKELAKSCYTKGFILDGFPRTLKQAELMLGWDLDLVLYLDVDDSVIIKRMSGRRVHAASGRVYHTIFSPPKVQGFDDVTGEPLSQRDDDKEEVVLKRLSLYHEQTEKIISWVESQYEMPDGVVRDFVRIDASLGLSEVWLNIEKVLDRILV